MTTPEKGRPADQSGPSEKFAFVVSRTRKNDKKQYNPDSPTPQLTTYSLNADLFVVEVAYA